VFYSRLLKIQTKRDENIKQMKNNIERNNIISNLIVTE